MGAAGEVSEGECCSRPIFFNFSSFITHTAPIFLIFFLIKRKRRESGGLSGAAGVLGVWWLCCGGAADQDKGVRGREGSGRKPSQKSSHPRTTLDRFSFLD